MRVRWQGRIVPLLAVLGLVGACRPGASCDLESDELSRDETAADGRPFFISNLEIGSDGAVAPGQEIEFSFDVERLSAAGSHAVGARLQGGPQTLIVMYAYPELPERSGPALHVTSPCRPTGQQGLDVVPPAVVRYGVSESITSSMSARNGAASAAVSLPELTNASS